MAFVPVGFGLAAFNFTHPQVARPAVVTLGVDMRAWTGSDDEAADDLFRTWALRMSGMQATASRLTHVDLYIGAGTEPSGSVRSSQPPQAGDNGGEMTPANVALLVRKNTTRLGRIGKGRMFIPFCVTDSAVDAGGNLAPADLQGYNTRLGLFYGDLVAEAPSGDGVLPPVVFRSNGSNPLVGTPSDVTSFTAQAKVGTQRRRIR